MNFLFYSFACGYPVFTALFNEEMTLFPCASLAPLSKTRSLYNFEFISVFFIIFSGQYVCLYVNTIHTVLITVALSDILKSGNMMPPALLFFLKIDLAIHCHLWFNMNSRFFPIFCEICHWNFYRDCITSVDHFG